MSYPHRFVSSELFAIHAAVRASETHGVRLRGFTLSRDSYRALWLDIATPEAWTEVPPPYIELHFGWPLRITCEAAP